MAIFRRHATPQPEPTRAAPARKGFEPDIPDGGTSVNQQSTTATQTRQADIDELFGAYTGCPPASTAIDAIARTITAGGLEIAEDTDDHERLHAAPRDLPAPVEGVKALLDYINPREDARQLMRNTVTDLQVSGDAFIEVTWAAGVPVALWHLDSATMIPDADEHGTIRGYIQYAGPTRQVRFEPHEVIHIRLDSPRGGVYGLSPTRKLPPTILGYIWTAALLKETMRRGNPPRFHMVFSEAEDLGEIKRFRDSYPARHLGPANIGQPVISKGARTEEFKVSAIAEYLTTLSDLRDVILSGYGVPGRKVGVEEKGALGGAGAEVGADRTFRVNTCGPLAELILEKLNFVILGAYGIAEGWRIKFGDVDWRDDMVLEQLRDLRLRNGSYTLNRYRDEIGEPPVDGGDVPVLVDRQNLVAWSDLPALSHATVRATEAKGAAAPGADDPDGGALPATPPLAGKSETVNPWGSEHIREQWRQRHTQILAALEAADDAV